ncbi:acetylglutamate kinase [Sporosarcina sp. JAI121]|uniref:acetylglutamate kinase n=1 Tax=Sporosarcina sp. JAI121 TaxID=2723064 RepID=UPI0015CAB584|nr:acetylglutamate kinase [Sporosarcina sp. JAI121]NYF25464.1 acetylglutamate kinase [Sporosarcina sp. JAI121]
MTMSKSTQHTDRKRMVVKLGGSMLEGLSEAFFTNFKKLQETGHELILVHGGGPFINKELAKNKITSSVVNGIRVTSKEAVGIVQSTLIGQVNPALVHQLNKGSVDAIGLNGSDGKLLVCTVLNEERYGSVGEIQHVRTELLEKILQAGLVPVVACIGATDDGAPLNINADTVASEIALAMNADSLLLVTDTPGISIEDCVQQTASPTEIGKWIETGEIYGGMLPKVKAALDCLGAGIPSVKIVGQQLEGTTIKCEEVFT